MRTARIGMDELVDASGQSLHVKQLVGLKHWARPISKALNLDEGRLTFHVLEAPDVADAIIDSKGLRQISDSGALEAIVDEVLAVGDAEFQKKCLGKMQDVAGHGRTVLFVSHNMAAVRKLCSSGLTLQGGAARFRGPVIDAITAMLEQVTGNRQKASTAAIDTLIENKGTLPNASAAPSPASPRGSG